MDYDTIMVAHAHHSHACTHLDPWSPYAHGPPFPRDDEEVRVRHEGPAHAPDVRKRRCVRILCALCGHCMCGCGYWCVYVLVKCACGCVSAFLIFVVLYCGRHIINYCVCFIVLCYAILRSFTAHVHVQAGSTWRSTARLQSNSP
jgi:hypothetical protein